MGDRLRLARWLRSEFHDRLRTMRAKSLPIVSSEELATWHTGSLVKRLEGLRKLDPSPELSDIVASEGPLAPGHIYFKSTEAWQVAFDDVRAALQGREHVPRGPERRAQRKARAKRGNSTERRRRR